MTAKSAAQILAERRKLREEGKAADKREKRAQQSVELGSERAERLFAGDHLREYQKISVLRALSNFRSNRNTLDASDMGLGKTRMAGAFIGTVGAPRINRAIWLTSLNLIPQTRKELSALGLKVVPVDAKNFEYVTESFDELRPKEQVIYIGNYQMMGNMSAKTREEKQVASYKGPKGTGWDALFVDECTALKGGANLSGPTALWKLMKSFIYEDQPQMFRYFLSGTPSENHPRELWATLHLFDQDRFPKLHWFEKGFCSTNDLGELVLNNEALFATLRTYIIRNTYESAGIELPEVTFDTIECPIDKDSDVYLLMKRLRQQFSLWLEDQPETLDVTNLLEHMLRQRQLLCTGSTFSFTKTEFSETGEPLGKIEGEFKFKGPFPKLDILEEKVFELINAGEQVVVFCCFNEPLYEVKQRFSMFGRVEIINGDHKNSKRLAEFVDDFQQGKIQVLCINKLSGAHGLNLQKCDQWPGGASHLFNIDMWWNPAREDQAWRRIVRMNTNMPCFVHYLHCVGEIDDVMKLINDKKRAMNEGVDAGLKVSKSEIQRLLGLK